MRDPAKGKMMNTGITIVLTLTVIQNIILLKFKRKSRHKVIPRHVSVFSPTRRKQKHQMTRRRKWQTKTEDSHSLLPTTLLPLSFSNFPNFATRQFLHFACFLHRLLAKRPHAFFGFPAQRVLSVLRRAPRRENKINHSAIHINDS